MANTGDMAVEILQSYALSIGCTNYLDCPKEQREAVAKLTALIDSEVRKELEKVLEYDNPKGYVKTKLKVLNTGDSNNAKD